MENVKIHDLKEARELAERIFDAKGLVPYKGRDGVAGYWMNIPAKLIVGIHSNPMSATGQRS